MIEDEPIVVEYDYWDWDNLSQSEKLDAFRNSNIVVHNHSVDGLFPWSETCFRTKLGMQDEIEVQGSCVFYHVVLYH